LRVINPDENFYLLLAMLSFIYTDEIPDLKKMQSKPAGNQFIKTYPLT